MKMRMAAGVALAFVMAVHAGTEATDLEMRNRALKAELKELEAKAVELENAAMRTEESIRISTVATELVEGTRKEPPRSMTVEKLIFEEGVAEPVFFDATAGKVKNRDVWLTEKMKHGSRYRFECEVKTEDLKGTDRVKFGAYMPVKGAPTEWPGVGQTGDGTYGWTKIQFSCTLPHGGSFMLGYGPNKGTGKVWFRNIRGYEVTDAPKAQLVPGNLLARELDVGSCMFRDRSFVLKECPGQLKGAPYLLGPFADDPSVRATVAQDGVVTVVSPGHGNVSQAKLLREQGFEIDKSVPEFQAWGRLVCDKASVWRKVARKGEEIRFGKWAFVCDFDASNMRVERPTEKNRELMARLRKELTADEALDVNTTSPDYAVFIAPNPGKRQERVKTATHDIYNDHFQVIYDEARKCHYAFWTQATQEPMPDHHTAFRKSVDGGRTWSPLRILAGTTNTNRALRATHISASWQQPMLAKTGRLYVLWSRGHDHKMGGRYSDDGGETWSEPDIVDFDPRTPREVREKQGRAAWWCNWQRPLRLGPEGHFLVGSSRGKDGLEFWEFLNIDENPAIKDVKIAVHSNGEKALKVPPDEKGVSVCEEASIMRLPDGRLFAVMRATGGAAVWSQSRDQGRNWTRPEQLRTRDGGELIRHSVSPCPCYDWKGCEAGSGLYFGLFHLEVTDHRGQLYLVPGRFDPKAHQPVAFSGKPKLFEPRSHWNSFYTSYTTDPRTGVGTLWYPDAAKFYLLGRDITPQFMKDILK